MSLLGVKREKMREETKLGRGVANPPSNDGKALERERKKENEIKSRAHLVIRNGGVTQGKLCRSILRTGAETIHQEFTRP